MTATKRISPFYINLDHGATSMSPLDAVEFMAEHAEKFGLSVHSEINGIKVIVFPGDTADQVRRAYEKVREKGRNFCAVNINP